LEARVAVRDALPFLKRASQVKSWQICTSSGQDLARHHLREVAKYLQGHQVKREAEVRASTWRKRMPVILFGLQRTRALT
jgi:hypothetical protein